MRTTVNDDSLKNNLAVSAGLHLAGLLFMYFGLPHFFTPLPSHHDPVPFEIVEIADITNTRVEKPEEQKQPPAPPPAPAPKTQQTQASAPMPEKVEALALPKPAEKPKPPTPEKPKDSLNFDKLLKDVAKLKPQQESKTDTKSDTKPQEQRSQAPALSNRLTITEEDALRRQIEKNWNIPIGARDIDKMVVEIHIDVNADRTVQHAEIIDKSRAYSDSFFRAVAESALRAVYASSPLELPPNDYEKWKGIDMSFSAKDML